MVVVLLVVGNKVFDIGLKMLLQVSTYIISSATLLVEIQVVDATPDCDEPSILLEKSIAFLASPRLSP